MLSGGLGRVAACAAAAEGSGSRPRVPARVQPAARRRGRIKAPGEVRVKKNKIEYAERGWLILVAAPIRKKLADLGKQAPFGMTDFVLFSEGDVLRGGARPGGPQQRPQVFRGDGARVGGRHRRQDRLGRLADQVLGEAVVRQRPRGVQLP